MTQTNTPSRNISEVSMEELDWAMFYIPEPIRRWMEYDSATPFNAVNALEAHQNGVPWSSIWEHMIAMSQREHHQANWPNPPEYMELRRNDPHLSAQIAAVRRQEGPTLQEFMRLLD